MKFVTIHNLGHMYYRNIQINLDLVLINDQLNGMF